MALNSASNFSQYALYFPPSLILISFAQVKAHSKKEYPAVEFRGEMGVMSAVIICDNHSGHSKKVFDLCDVDEKGRVSKSYLINARRLTLFIYLDRLTSFHRDLQTSAK